MSFRRFSKVSPDLWRSVKLKGLSDKGTIALFYYSTCAHVTSAGCYEISDGYACADLRWDLETYQRARNELLDAGMIDFDSENSVVLIENWFEYNPPMNPKHTKGARALLRKVPSIRLREKADDALTLADEQRAAAQSDREAERAIEKVLDRANHGSSFGKTSGKKSGLFDTDYMRRNRQ